MVENVVPPVPADAAVLLGAFLSHRGVTDPFGVFLVVWVCNVGGALAVYLVARRYGRQLFASPRGRKLLAPESIAVIEREYLRFGVGGIFLARFLPGIRAVVPPFAGIVNLSPARAAIPIALASAVWYGGVTILGTVLGSQWQRIAAILASVNRALGVVALVVVVGWGARIYLRARRRRRERVWDAVTRALGTTRWATIRGRSIRAKPPCSCSSSPTPTRRSPPRSARSSWSTSARAGGSSRRRARPRRSPRPRPSRGSARTASG